MTEHDSWGGGQQKCGPKKVVQIQFGRRFHIQLDSLYVAEGVPSRNPRLEKNCPFWAAFGPVSWLLE